MNKEIEKLNEKYEKLIKSDFLTFEEVAAMVGVMGVYIIYNHKQEVFYIGNTNNLKVRFGTDLKHEATHTLVKKLLKIAGFTDRLKVVEYLKTKCLVQIEKCASKREAEALEGIAIYILNPEQNK